MMKKIGLIGTPNMQIKINRRSAYAPIRYEATRPFAVPISKAYVAASKRGEEARIAFVKRQLLPLLRTAAVNLGREQGPGPLQSEAVNIQVFGSYVDSGKVIWACPNFCVNGSDFN
jgi:hypothetical protein